MSRSRRGSAASQVLSSAARLGVLGLAVVAAGCASKHASHEPPARVAGPAGAPQAAWATKVEIEDDGLPVQLAPRHRPATPDDPSEPWSPNYGKGRAPKTAAPMRAPVQLSGLDEDAIVRRAIAEHEMRRRD